MNSLVVKDLAKNTPAPTRRPLEEKGPRFKKGENNICIFPRGRYVHDKRGDSFGKNLVLKELQLYNNPLKYPKDIIYIFKKAEFLFACYPKIKQCKTRDRGIFEGFILNLSNSIVKGQFNFSVNAFYKKGDFLKRPKINYNDNGSKMAKLKDKIVLKGLVTMLKVI